MWCTSCGSVQPIAIELRSLEEPLGDSYAGFELVNSVLGRELWEKNFKSLFSLVNEYIVNMWEVRKNICKAMTHALINFSLSPQLVSITGVDGIIMCVSIMQMQFLG